MTNTHDLFSSVTDDEALLKAKADRAALKDRLAEIDWQIETLKKFDAERLAAQADLDRFDESETEALLAFTRGGLLGKTPVPNPAQRAKLLDRLDKAARQAEIAQRSVEHLQSERASIAQAVVALNPVLHDLAAARLTRHAQKLVDRCNELREEFTAVEGALSAIQHWADEKAYQYFLAKNASTPDHLKRKTCLRNKSLDALRNEARKGLHNPAPAAWPLGHPDTVQRVAQLFQSLQS
jgi:hypothetical protein